MAELLSGLWALSELANEDSRDMDRYGVLSVVLKTLFRGLSGTASHVSASYRSGTSLFFSTECGSE